MVHPCRPPAAALLLALLAAGLHAAAGQVAFVQVAEGQTASASCGSTLRISAILNAVYGDSSKGCVAANSYTVVAGACLGKVSCSVLASNTVFGDPVRPRERLVHPRRPLHGPSQLPALCLTRLPGLPPPPHSPLQCFGVPKYLEFGYTCAPPPPSPPPPNPSPPPPSPPNPPSPPSPPNPPPPPPAPVSLYTSLGVSSTGGLQVATGTQWGAAVFRCALLGSQGWLAGR